MSCHMSYRYSGWTVHYVAPCMKILDPCHSYRDHGGGEARSEKLAKYCTYAPGNNPSRGPWALLSEFHLITAPNISVTQSPNAVHLVRKQ